MMIAAMRERKRFHYTGRSYYTGLLQFYKFLINSRIDWCKVKIFISVSYICFLNKFLRADLLIYFQVNCSIVALQIGKINSFI